MIGGVFRKLVIIGAVTPRGVFCCGGRGEVLKDSMIATDVYNKPSSTGSVWNVQPMCMLAVSDRSF